MRCAKISRLHLLFIVPETYFVHIAYLVLLCNVTYRIGLGIGRYLVLKAWIEAKKKKRIQDIPTSHLQCSDWSVVFPTGETAGHL